MKDKFKKIRFQGNEYILVGHLLHGAIATEEQYKNGRPSYAHACRDGKLRRYGKVIGSVSEIEVVGEVEIETPSLANLIDNIKNDPDWRPRR
jgi:hypothetical protein